MSKAISKNKFWFVVIVFCLVFSLSSSNAFAWGGHGHGHYYYRGGRWYDNGWFWGGVAVSALTIGAIVATLPPHYSVIYVNGVPYYYDGAYYYQSYPGGYAVVANPTVVVPAVTTPVAVVSAPTQAVVTPAPVVTQVSAKLSAVTVNIPNKNGGFTPVVLAKKGNGYIGPQGEYYQGHPTVEQLKVLYGK